MVRPLFRTDPIQLRLVWICAFSLLLLLDISGCRVGAQFPDRDAMTAVRNSLIRNNTFGTKFSGWNDSTPYCNWHGVTCDSEGVVTNITLSVFLGGSISEELGRLAGLQVLHLKRCHLEGGIPESINKLRNLRILDLSGNNLAGTIPGLESLTNLVKLSLGSNELQGAIPNLSRSENLTALMLSLNQLTGVIHVQDWENSALEILDLSLNNFSGRIPVAINKLRTLRVLDLSFNSLDGLIPVMENLTNLEELYLESNYLEGTLPSMKGTLGNLTLLSMGFNYLTGGIPDWDWEHSSIQVLILHDNYLSGSIPAAIVKLPMLSLLDLSSNKLQGTIPSLERLPNILSVDLSDNHFTGGIPGWEWNGDVWENHTLKILDLSRNKLSGIIPGPLFFILHDLNLSSNSFYALNMSTSIDGHYVGYPRYGVNSGLKFLDLSYNPLQIGAHYMFPGQVFGRLNFPKLLELWLEESQLSGDISIYLFDFFSGDSTSSAFPVLKVLRCAGNNLSGVVKSSWNSADSNSGRLLEVLDLSRNPNLTLFDTPETEKSFLQMILLGRFPFLHELQLSNIRSTGVLPARLGYLEFLQVLDLSHNNLGGSLSDAYNKNTLPALVSLDLSYNRLAGEVPQNLTELDLLKCLNLSNNRFSGKLPGFLDPNYAGRGIKLFRFDATSFLGNEGLCGEPLSPCLSYARKTHIWALFLGVASASGIASTVCLVLARHWTLRVYTKRDPQDVDLVQLLNASTTPLMSLKVLKRATKNFSDSLKIGPGGCGGVYFGVLDDGTQVAIKRDVNDGSHGELEKKRFLNEVKVLSQVNHKNLVKLVGCCRDRKMDALVFEYAPNGTLLQHLRRKQQRLSWSERLLIGLQTADALAYLHFSASPPIYHLDVKSANILLTENLNAKLADFGISKLAPREGTLITTPEGTPGYMDPEYFASCKPTDKSDVFSFGVVLLELISGKPVSDFSRNFENPSLASFALPLIRSGELETLLDPSMSEIVGCAQKREQVLRVASLAESCLRERSKDRPTMKEVWKELHSVWVGPDNLRAANSVEINTSYHLDTVLHRSL